MGGVRAPVFARTGEGDPLLVTGELYELAELLLSEHLQCAPEKLDVLIGLHQPHLVHGVCLGEKRKPGVHRCFPPPLRGQKGRVITPLSPVLLPFQNH